MGDIFAELFGPSPFELAEHIREVKLHLWATDCAILEELIDSGVIDAGAGARIVKRRVAWLALLDQKQQARDEKAAEEFEAKNPGVVSLFRAIGERMKKPDAPHQEPSGP